MKRLVAIAVVVTMLMSFMTFTTVSAENTNLENMIKACNVQIPRANVKMNAIMTVNGGLCDYIGMPTGQLAEFIYNIDYVSNQELNKVDMAGNFTISAPKLVPQPISFDMWAKEDATNIDNIQFFMILRIADFLRQQAEVSQEYIYMDFTQIPGFEEMMKFALTMDEAELEQLIKMLTDALNEYLGADVIALLEQKILGIIDDINVEYAGGKYSLIMGDAQLKELYGALFGVLFDLIETMAEKEGVEVPQEYYTGKAELMEAGRKIAAVQIFDNTRGFVVEVAEDGSFVHTEVNIVANYYDIVAAVDPASIQGMPANFRDMLGLNLSVSADAAVTPLSEDYQITFPELTDGNTIDATEQYAPLQDEMKFESASVEIEYNGERISLENIPVLYEDRTFVPLRELANTFGIGDENIHYDEATQKVTIKNEDVEIVMYIGSTMTFVNGQMMTLDVPAFTNNDRTYIPVRFVSEMFNKKVDYVDLNATGQGNGIVVMIND